VFLRIGAQPATKGRHYRLRPSLSHIEYDSSKYSLEVLHAVLCNPALGPHVRTIEYKFLTRIETQQRLARNHRDRVTPPFAAECFQESKKLELVSRSDSHTALLERALGYVQPSLSHMKIKISPSKALSLIPVLRSRWAACFALIKAVSANAQSWTVPVHIEVVDACLFSGTSHASEAFANLTTVTLVFWDTQLPKFTDVKRGWSKVLASAQQLVRLELRLTHPTPRRLPGDLTGKRSRSASLLRSLLIGQQWKHMSTLKLVCFDLWAPDLKVFAKRNRANITELITRNVNVDDAEWQLALNIMRNEFDLQSASITFGATIGMSDEFQQFGRMHGTERFERFGLAWNKLIKTTNYDMAKYILKKAS